MEETTTPEVKKSSPHTGKYTLVNLNELDDIRKVWKHEALDFTKWMSEPENIRCLGKALDFDFDTNTIDTESKGGQSNRRCDVVVRLASEEDGDDESTGEIVAIENQLEKTDFSHLGRLILYAALKKATRIVWVVKEATYDCRKAIAWLNENTSDSLRFYLVEIVVYDLKENRAAPIFRLVEKPDEERKAHDSNDPRRKRNYDFWNGFIDFINEEPDNAADGNCHAKLNFINALPQPSGDNWYSIYIGTGKCHINLWDSHGRVDFAIQTDSKETCDKLEGVAHEMAQALGIAKDDYDFGKQNAVRPRIRFKGPNCDIENPQHAGTREAYGWLVKCLATAVPLIQRVLGVK